MSSIYQMQMEKLPFGKSEKKLVKKESAETASRDWDLSQSQHQRDFNYVNAAHEEI
jgi:hypothetical protein